MADNPRKYLFRLSAAMNLKRMAGLTGQKTIFPFYHAVSDAKLPHLSHLYSIKNLSQFEADLETLLKVFRPVSIEDYLKESTGIGGKPRMIISFDDGLSECHWYIAPLLKEKGVPAIFFLNNDFIDNKGLFYRYKASLLIEHIGEDRSLLMKAVKWLDSSPEQVTKALLLLDSTQRSVLDSLSQDLGFDETNYLLNNQVYMTSDQVRDLIDWGFHLGAHGTNHTEFYDKEEHVMAEQVQLSIINLQQRFQAKPSCFAFPFTSDGIPERVIRHLLDEGIAEVLFGTAGLKHTGSRKFIQRIPMEVAGRSAKEVLKTEYLYYLLKAPLGQNRYFRTR